MKIAYIITSMGVGGAEIVTIDIANHMSRMQNEVLILYLTGKNSNQDKIDKSVQVIGLNMTKSPINFIKVLFYAKTILKNFSPDIVHGQMFHANIFSRILRVFYKFPCLICSEHSKIIGIGIFLRLYRITDFLSDLNTNVSKEATEFFIRQKAFSNNKSIHMYNGIDLKKFYPNNIRKDMRKPYTITDNEFLFLNVGRLTLAKDQKNLIEAFSLLCKEYKNVKLMIIGTGEFEKELKNFVLQKNVKDYVIFAGNKNNVYDYYNCADCFVLSSAWEGFGLVIVESMACALPVIATNAGGIREVLNNDEFIVPIKDSFALYKKMKYMYSLTNEKRKELGNKNLNRAKIFDIDSIASKWLNIYKNLKNNSWTWFSTDHKHHRHKRFIKHMYSHWHRHWTEKHHKRFEKFNLIFQNNPSIKLSTAVPGVYKFASSNNNDKGLNHRLLEIGFIPGIRLRVIKNTGEKGSLLLKIKGSKIVLSNKIADKILVERNHHIWPKTKV
ncbi:MAG: glycosyltransferase [Endomicrobium sp.]|jgi:glycosyltransferase involved in cell wall biosynthesis/Fe2+ transport system protein FeoA|nr:glycosyltransferase [Endomicrobium sp.]